MSTLEEFESAPVGATATDPDGRVAVKTFDDDIDPWMTRDYKWLSDKDMAENGYKLDTLAPTSAREAFDLTWELAHEVKEGQVIPKGMRYVRRYQSGDLATFISNESWTPRYKDKVRTQDPIPDPEPDWTKAPAVLARVDCWASCDDPQVFVRGDYEGAPSEWLCNGVESYPWQDLRDVTPLYPKEG